MSCRNAFLALLSCCLGSVGCGGVVVHPDGESRSEADAAVSADAPPPTPVTSPSCSEVRASCGPEPQRFVRGHAEGLTELEGARVQFAVRYLRTSGVGLNIPHGVVSAWGRVARGAVEACVCLPRGGNEYPQIAAVAFAPGSSGETPRDVLRAMYSQRYATLGDEDLAFGLREVPSAGQVEAALAAMSDRASTVTLRGLDAATVGQRVYGGLVADERRIAAQVAGAAVEGASARFEWIMPGRYWPSEALAVVVDRNANRRCDEGDLGARVRLDGRSEVTVPAWLRGAELASVCAAVGLEVQRE